MEEDSLTRRLAGQSVGKAGLALDQSEISRIIAEASKGSKFYENERKKDEALTIKIEKLIKKKDDIMRGVDVAAVEAGVDRMLGEMEAARDLSQTIVHIDCDAFYASVEVLDNPSLAGKAFGVCPGVLTTASYEARKYGVRSAMPAFIAKKLCPHLILVPVHFDRYAEMSEQVMDVLRTRDPTMSVVSVDEAYLNITEYCREHDLMPEKCVQQLRAEVEEKTKLTVSAGIAPNKMLAKICSERNKPNGQYLLSFDRESIMDFMKDLPIRKVPGIGKVSERLLQSFGIKTCGDIYPQRAVISMMDHWLGLRSLLRAYLGLASNNVQPGKREERKSVGAERTFHETSNPEFLIKKLEEIAASLEADLEETGFAARTITLKYKLHTFKLFTRAKSCSRWITSKNDLFEIGKELLAKEMPLKLRLIGLQASHLKDLRVDKDKGIMKFLAPGAKRRKIDEDNYIVLLSDGEDVTADKPEVEDKLQTEGNVEVEPDSDDSGPSMAQKPNFFGSDDDDEDIDATKTPGSGPSHIKPHSHSGVFLKPTAGSSTARLPQRKPVSAISPSPTPSTITMKNKPRPNPRPKERPLALPLETLVCPVCSRSLETDNAGLNAHVDFCLSRGVILQASAEGASGSGRPKTDMKKGSGRKSAGKGVRSAVGTKRTNPFSNVK